MVILRTQQELKSSPSNRQLLKQEQKILRSRKDGNLSTTALLPHFLSSFSCFWYLPSCFSFLLEGQHLEEWEEPILNTSRWKMSTENWINKRLWQSQKWKAMKKWGNVICWGLKSYKSSTTELLQKKADHQLLSQRLKNHLQQNNLLRIAPEKKKLKNKTKTLSMRWMKSVMLLLIQRSKMLGHKWEVSKNRKWNLSKAKLSSSNKILQLRKKKLPQMMKNWIRSEILSVVEPLKKISDFN